MTAPQLEGTPNGSELTCREILDLLMDFIDGQLPPLQQATIEAHLASCPDCRDYIETYRRTIELEKRIHSVSPIEEQLRAIPEELIQAILDARQGLPKSSPPP